MITMKEMQDIDTVLTRLDNCIAKQEAQNASVLELYQQGLETLSKFKDNRRVLNLFLNSATLDTETINIHATLIEGKKP